MSERVRIVGALSIGVIIILVSFQVSTRTAANQEAFVIAATPRDYIETNDLNGDGTPDWEEHLAENIFKTITLPTSLESGSSSPSYTPPTTLTGRFSEAFIQDYLQGKIDGKDFSDPSAFIATALSAIEKNAQSKQYTRADIRTEPETADNVRAYGNALQDIITRHSKGATENEMVILLRALETKSPETLSGLVPIRVGYENIINDTLALSVPETLAREHIAILNAYEGILTDIYAGEAAFNDPLYTLARVRDYEMHAKALLGAYVTLAQRLVEKGVVYTSDEPGAVYRTFEHIAI